MIAAVSSWSKGATYCRQVLAGELVVPETIIGVCRRHVDDLGRTDGLFYFDESAAELAIDKIEKLLRHSIGIHAGQPFILEPWQAFGIGLLFGWKRTADGSRRFRELYWSTGRKNGKSTVAAALAIILAALDNNPVSGGLERVSEVVLAATKREQSLKVIFAEILRMRSQSPEIAGISKPVHGSLRFTHNDGTIHCVGSNKDYDGLSPSAAILDEVHAFTESHRRFYNTMTTGSGARLQPIAPAIFTTAGDTRSFLWIGIYNFMRSVATRSIEADHVLPMIYEIDPEDDPLNPDTWIKANPNLGVSLRLEYLEQQASKARTTPQELAVFTRYHANRMVDANAKAFDEKQWAACKGELSDWRLSDGLGAGVDIGGRDDLASIAVCARFDIGESDDNGRPVYRFEGRQQSFISTNTERDLTAEPFASFIRDGQLIVCQDPIEQMKSEMLRWLADMPIDSVAYDPAGGQQFAENVEAEGYAIASMGQTYRHFHEPIVELQRAIADGRFRHNGDALLAFALGNAVTVQNRQCQFMYNKRDSASKIDPAVALTMAFRRCMAARSRLSGPLFIQ